MVLMHAQLMSPQDIKQALLDGRFQPHAAPRMIDFLDRHGYLSEGDCIEEMRWRMKRDQGVAKPVGGTFT
jgi:hypothetical protein